MIRSKFQLVEKREHAYAAAKTFIFEPRYDETIPEDKRFFQATPTGRLEITVSNAVVQEEWKLGDYYYFDATPVKAE